METVETPQPVQPTESKSTDWTKIILAAVLGIGLLAASAYAGYYYGTQQVQPAEKPTPVVSQPPPTPLIDDQTTDCRALETLEMEKLTQVSKTVCQNCGGKWELLSMDVDATGCNPKTNDVGKTCTNYDQCIGFCLAEEEVSTSGVCSEYKYRLGCSLELSEGKPVMTCRD